MKDDVSNWLLLIGQAHGGTGFFARINRIYYDSTTTFKGMWYGNPVLTTVIIGLPLGFLSLICYSMWCADIMDAAEEDNSNQSFSNITLSLMSLCPQTNLVVPRDAKTGFSRRWLLTKLVIILVFLFHLENLSWLIWLNFVKERERSNGRFHLVYSCSRKRRIAALDPDASSSSHILQNSSIKSERYH